MKKSTGKITRRGMLQAGSGLALGSVLGELGETAPLALPSPGARRPSVYEALGVRHVINATGTMTYLGGSVMPPEVVAAWALASRHFVNLYDLHDKVGRQIARLIGVEAALVTTGAAGALLLGTAAAVTRGDRNLIRRLPDTLGMRNEVIMQRSHHTCYDNQLTDVGVKLIDVETVADLQGAVNERTALMFFMNLAEPDGRIGRRAWVALAKRYRVPTLLDAAADVPPLERLSVYNRMGFDLVAFSGGKALRGPNDTGLLLGRRALIEAAKLNTNPHCGTIGRMMKVSKEDMIALLAAVERFVHLDHDAEWRAWERKIDVIAQALKGIPHLHCEHVVPEIANCVPHLLLRWQERRLGITREQVIQALLAGDPPIEIGRVRGTGERGMLVSVLTLQDGEECVLGERLRAVLRSGRAGEKR
jgi:L-seryl-tRNA(Ser) seleniumtransferase